MAKLTIISKSPKALQDDGTTCGHRSLREIIDSDTKFDPDKHVEVIQRQILEARNRKKQDARQLTSGSDNSVTESDKIKRITQLALVIACKLGLLPEAIRSDVAAAYQNIQKPTWSNEALNYFNSHAANSPHKQQLESVIQLARKLYKKGVGFVNVRDLSPNEGSNGAFKRRYGNRDGLQQLERHLDVWMGQDCSVVHQQDDVSNSLIKEGTVLSRAQWLQGPDIRVWCNDFNSKQKQLEDESDSSHRRASVAARGSDDDPLIEVQIAVRKVLQRKGRRGPEELNFVVNNNDTTGSERGSHWTHLKVTIQKNNDVEAVYTDSQNDGGSEKPEGVKEFLKLVETAIQMGFEAAGIEALNTSKEESEDEDDSTTRAKHESQKTSML